MRFWTRLTQPRRIQRTMVTNKMITAEEISETRQLAAKIRKLKEDNYATLTWDEAIKLVVSAHAKSENDSFRKTALLAFFIAEDRKLCSLSDFLEGLDSEIVNLKEHSKNYAITETERVVLSQKITNHLSGKKYPTDKNRAFDYYQILIDKIFISRSLPELMQTLCELAQVLKEFYPGAFPEVHMLVESRDKLQQAIDIAKEPATKKQIAFALGVGVESVGALMCRFTQLGIFEVTKKGRENLYAFKKSDFDVNTIRKEWSWLWSSPYKRLSMKLFDQP